MFTCKFYHYKRYPIGANRGLQTAPNQPPPTLILRDYKTLSGIAPILEWGYPSKRDEKSNETENFQKCGTTLKKEKPPLCSLEGKMLRNILSVPITRKMHSNQKKASTED